MPRSEGPAEGYQPPSLHQARKKLLAGLLIGGFCFVVAALVNSQFLAWERGEEVSAPMPSILIDLYEWGGRPLPVGALAVFGAFMVGVGVVGWWRERKAAGRLPLDAPGSRAG